MRVATIRTPGGSAAARVDDETVTVLPYGDVVELLASGRNWPARAADVSGDTLGCYRTTQLMSGDMTFVLSNAGRIPSLVNPPGNPKAYYFAGPKPGPDPDAFRAAADRVPGTWWEHWVDWVSARSGDEVTAPKTLGSSAYPVLESAPGSYVLERPLAARTPGW
jgi:hypothetical protein